MKILDMTWHCNFCDATSTKTEDFDSGPKGWRVISFEAAKVHLNCCPSCDPNREKALEVALLRKHETVEAYRDAWKGTRREYDRLVGDGESFDGIPREYASVNKKLVHFVLAKPLVIGRDETFEVEWRQTQAPTPIASGLVSKAVEEPVFVIRKAKTPERDVLRVVRDVVIVVDDNRLGRPK